MGLAALVIAAVCVAFGVNLTNATFSDTKSGTISGTLGSVHVTTAGGTGTDSLDFAFSNLMPGVPQTATATYTNSGSGPEDVYVVFPNATALSALNTLGTYGSVHVLSNGTEVFGSNNLNDRSSTCGAFSSSGCNPLPGKILLASNVAPGASGTLKFTFGYASKLATQPPAGTTAQFNQYPVAGQTTVKDADGSGSGLPYQVVAVEAGQSLG